MFLLNHSKFKDRGFVLAVKNNINLQVLQIWQIGKYFFIYGVDSVFVQVQVLHVLQPSENPIAKSSDVIIIEKQSVELIQMLEGSLWNLQIVTRERSSQHVAW